jgi:hypothetical protein
MKAVSTFCGQNAELLLVKTGGKIYNYRWNLGLMIIRFNKEK